MPALMMIGVDTPDTLLQGTAAAVLALISAVSIGYARKAASRSKDNTEALQVPSTNGNGSSKTGESLSRVERDIAQMNERAKEAVVVARETATKLEALQLAFAQHAGEHAGMQRDVDRLLRKVFSGEMA